MTREVCHSYRTWLFVGLMGAVGCAGCQSGGGGEEGGTPVVEEDTSEDDASARDVAEEADAARDVADDTSSRDGSEPDIAEDTSGARDASNMSDAASGGDDASGSDRDASDMSDATSSGDGTSVVDGRTSPDDVRGQPDTLPDMRRPDVRTGPDDTSTRPWGPDTSNDTDTAGTPSATLKPKYRNAFSKSCNSSNPPSRCRTSPGSFSNWGPASVVTDLNLLTSKAQSCCVDFDVGNEPGGDVDNAFGQLLAQFQSQFDVDRAIQRAIGRGELLLTFEHEGLSGLNNSKGFTVHTYTASKAKTGASLTPGIDLELDSASLDAGVYPTHSIGPARLQGGQLSGVSGEARLPLGRVFAESGSGGGLGALVGAMLFSGPLQGAVVRGDVVASSSSLGDKGVTIQNGTLAGYRTLRGIFEGLNRTLSNCGCLNNPDPQTNPVFQIAYKSSSDPDLCPPSNPNCSQPISCDRQLARRAQSFCNTRRDPNYCSGVSAACGLNLISILKSQADLDVDGDGYRDALSFGSRFEATGADLTGVSSSSP